VISILVVLPRPSQDSKSKLYPYTASLTVERRHNGDLFKKVYSCYSKVHEKRFQESRQYPSDLQPATVHSRWLYGPRCLLWWQDHEDPSETENGYPWLTAPLRAESVCQQLGITSYHFLSPWGTGMERWSEAVTKWSEGGSQGQGSQSVNRPGEAVPLSTDST